MTEILNTEGGEDRIINTEGGAVRVKNTRLAGQPAMTEITANKVLWLNAQTTASPL